VNNSHVAVDIKDDLGHFTSSEQHIDGCIWQAKHDFLLVFYRDLSLDKTAVDLQVVENSRSITPKNIKNSSGNITGWPLSRHYEIPWQFPDNARHSCPCQVVLIACLYYWCM